MSISWGSREDSWTAQARHALDAAFVDAAAPGVTVCVAAGDNGSSDGAPGGRSHVDFPASSPHALACGGTRLRLGADGSVAAETVLGRAGQQRRHRRRRQRRLPAAPLAGRRRRAGTAGGGTGRGVPDVAGDADPASGYEVLVDGQRSVIGGTSAVALLWAGLVARLVQALGRPLGLLQPALYAGAAPGALPAGLRDITTGTNGAFSAHLGWDACTGLGVPDGEALLARLRAARPASPPP